MEGTAGQGDVGVDDTATLIHSVGSTDTNYDGLSVLSVNVIVAEDDAVGVRMSETSLTMDEGDSDNYTVALDTQLLGDVKVTIGGICGTDLTLDKSSLTFTTANWDTPQTVTAGQDNDGMDDTPPLTHSVSSTSDSVTEGDTVEVTVSLCADPEWEVEIEIAKVN